MSLSVFLAKAIGLYYVLISLAFLVNKTRLRALMIETINTPASLLLSGFIALIIGIMLVVSHRLGVGDWHVLLTIVGWLALLKGLTLMFCPQVLVTLSLKWMQNEVAYTLTFLLTLFLGIVLLYFGTTQGSGIE